MLLGVGCDIVEIVRIKRAMEKESFLRVLSEQERKLFDRIPKERRAEWLAGRFAAKEACGGRSKRTPCGMAGRSLCG